MMHTRKRARPSHHMSRYMSGHKTSLQSHALCTEGKLLPNVHRQIATPDGDAMADRLEVVIVLVVFLLLIEDTQRLLFVDVCGPNAVQCLDHLTTSGLVRVYLMAMGS
jgi:hypothetical protein